ncbi:hypothetical protein GCM10010347_33550 [Streptomyces cirratus]|uniref:Uncharacterized protein n=1 Tax=Streptomyces cirratus TaxID=68187 RepID=A0ABQ3ETP9_9ACTN|nr:hypothetical protein GCM10010347_33550 [Streptomyces cirratus]
MGGRQQGIQDHGVVPAPTQGGDDVRADEPGSSGDEYAHAPDATESAAPPAPAARRRKGSVTSTAPSGGPQPLVTEASTPRHRKGIRVASGSRMA